MSTDIFSQLDALLQEARESELQDSATLEAYRIRFLGSKNVLKDYFGRIKEVPNERKKEYGQRVNEVKQAAEARYQEVKDALDAAADQSAPADLDLSRPGAPVPLGSLHPITVTLNKIVDVFTRMGFAIAEDREIEDDWHNFTAMNTPDDHPARDMQDTFYLKGSQNILLRTHTSSVQARVMTSQQPPIRIIAPGRVYRNETVSARSHCQFHQVEGLYIDKGVSFADMKQVLLQFAREMYGADVKIRLRASYFPFTEPSAEMDVYWGLKDETDHRITKGTGWLEILGCGMVDPQVLINCGLDPEVYSGFAFGMGIERQVMLSYRIGDIRYFFENDVRFIQQFTSAY